MKGNKFLKRAGRRKGSLKSLTKQERKNPMSKGGHEGRMALSSISIWDWEETEESIG